MHPVEAYLTGLFAVHGAAVPETSYYPVLRDLFDAVGKTLKPRVVCVVHPQDQGAGLPDMGLFLAEQLGRGAGAAFPPGLPARGAIEVKGAAPALEAIVKTEQVAKYLAIYNQLLVTNLRDFGLVIAGPGGKAELVERYTLAPAEDAFWAQVAAHPRKAADRHGDALVEFLQRSLQRPAPITTSQALAWFLASYAREAQRRVEAQPDLPELKRVRAALEGALGMTFEGAEGEHFFRSTLVQTLFYGIFAAWVLWHKAHPEPEAVFSWEKAARYLDVPAIQALFDQVSGYGRLKKLNLVGPLDRAADALNRVDRVALFAHFEEEHAVQYFYEPFLQAFDPQLRKELGVWYTPPEVIEYMVARVDAALRSELGLPDGLADDRVTLLDPCCGTGGYLVAALERIAATLEENGEAALVAHRLKRAATGRVLGFELLPAPFVIAHLQLGLLLQRRGAPLQEGERAGVYLTNALTGWEPPDAQKEQALQLTLEGLPELREERDAARKVKRETPILVVLGNPPYNGLAGVAMGEERSLSNAYRAPKRAPAPQGQGLNDLYVRFYRMAERRIVEQTGRGIVCFISNYSWLDGLSFTGMRERYLDAFDRIWIDSLNGDKYRTGKLTPEGLPDPSIFSTEFNREGIQVGTAIALFVRETGSAGTDCVMFRQFWGKNKRADLLESLTDDNEGPEYQSLCPSPALGLPFTPTVMESEYEAWPRLTSLLPVSFPGLQTGRDNFLIDVDKTALEKRVNRYFDNSVSDAEVAAQWPQLMKDSARYSARATRAKLLARGQPGNTIFRFHYRPFDSRWLYWEPETKLLDEKRAEYVPHVFPGNVWLAAAAANRKDFDPPLVLSHHASRHVIERGANLFPAYLKQVAQVNLFGEGGSGGPQPNLSDEARAYLEKLQIEAADTLFYHCVAVLHAPVYAQGNATVLRQDWPRIPLPATREALLRSAALGRQVAALLDTETPVPGVTTGALRSELKPIAQLTRVGGGQLDPDAGDLALTVGWGHGGQDGVTMPGKGRAVSRPAEAGAPAALGAETFDVYLNDAACWRNVPARVWETTIGGYQVIKKWLSYREAAVLGRGLTADEAGEVTRIARRLAALALLGPALDANYAAAAGATWAWPDSGVGRPT